MAITRKKNLGLLLIEAGIIEPEQLEQALLKQSKEINEHLNSLGFKLKEKKHSEIIEKSSKFSSFYNQIWVKNNQ